MSVKRALEIAVQYNNGCAQYPSGIRLCRYDLVWFHSGMPARHISVLEERHHCDKVPMWQPTGHDFIEPCVE